MVPMAEMIRSLGDSLIVIFHIQDALLIIQPINQL